MIVLISNETFAEATNLQYLYVFKTSLFDIFCALIYKSTEARPKEKCFPCMRHILDRSKTIDVIIFLQWRGLGPVKNAFVVMLKESTPVPGNSQQSDNVPMLMLTLSVSICHSIIKSSQSEEIVWRQK